jgi:hypothetical protein
MTHALITSEQITEIAQKALFAELIAGRAVVLEDIPVLISTQPSILTSWLSDEDFKLQVERNKKRLDHVNRFNNYIAEKMGIRTTLPVGVNSWEKHDSISKEILVQKFGLGFIKHAIALALEIGPDNAARILGVGIKDIKNWMFSESAKISSIRENLKDRFIGKALDVADKILDKLNDDTRLEKSSTKELALALGVVHDRASDTIKGAYSDAKTAQLDSSTGSSVQEITNIVNIMISDAAVKKDMQDTILKKMGLYKEGGHALSAPAYTGVGSVGANNDVVDVDYVESIDITEDSTTSGDSEVH